MAEGVTHISLPTQEYDRGRQEKTNRRTNTNKAWGYQEQREVCNTTCMCIPNSRYGLTLAWVTSENSTMLLESDILRLFFTGPFLSPRLSVPVSGVDCPSVDPRQLPLLVQSQLLTASLWVASSTLILGSPYHFRIRRDFMSKNPLSGFAPKQTIESSALAAYPHSATHSYMVFEYTYPKPLFCKQLYSIK